MCASQLEFRGLKDLECPLDSLYLHDYKGNIINIKFPFLGIIKPLNNFGLMYNVQNVVKENQFNIIISVSIVQHNLLIIHLLKLNIL